MNQQENKDKRISFLSVLSSLAPLMKDKSNEDMAREAQKVVDWLFKVYPYNGMTHVIQREESHPNVTGPL